MRETAAFSLGHAQEALRGVKDRGASSLVASAEACGGGEAFPQAARREETERNAHTCFRDTPGVLHFLLWMSRGSVSGSVETIYGISVDDDAVPIDRSRPLKGAGSGYAVVHAVDVQESPRFHIR